VEGADVVVDWHAGPMLAQDVLTEGVDFNELDGSHSGSLESKAEAADAAE
jgi:hypothetical protein